MSDRRVEYPWYIYNPKTKQVLAREAGGTETDYFPMLDLSKGLMADFEVSDVMDLIDEANKTVSYEVIPD